MKFCSIVGTRPNFVKEFLINRECKKRGIREILVHTGQHYDYEMSKIFFEGFNLPVPDHNLSVQNSDSAHFSGEVMIRLSKLFVEEKPDFVLSYGDVNSTLSAAVASTKNNIPFVHVEGGIRSKDLYNPEEINRRVADVLAEVIYCCTKTDLKNLLNENYDRKRIVFSGDLMKDALDYTLEANSVELSRGNYMVLTLHRQENVMNPKKLEAIIDGIIDSNREVVFPVHPRTTKQIETNGLLKKVLKSKISLLKPMAYLDFVRLMAGADKILTDSGGVRREAYLLKKPCIVLIDLSWFPEISEAGWKVLTEPDAGKIAQLINEFEPTGEHREIFGDGKAHVKIVGDLVNRFEK